MIKLHQIIQKFPEFSKKYICAIVSDMSKVINNILSPFYTISEDPIFILGNQRSGTTIISNLLAYISNISIQSDLKNINRSYEQYIDFSNNIDFNEFIHKNKFEFSKKIIKEPNLTPFFNKIYKKFPQSKYIMIVRDPRSNIRSILDRNKIPGDLTKLNKSDKKEILFSWNLVFGEQLFGGDYYIDTLAKRWKEFTDIYLENRDKIVLVRYEDFIKDKVGCIKNLAESIKLPLKNKIENKVDKQYQSSGQNRGVNWIDFYGENNLRTIENICTENMQKLGYEKSDL